jgi:DhnA family fructose-bisphosphate aldolase class Ia
VSFQQAINELVRGGAGVDTGRRTFQTETASLGTSSVNLDRALRVVADLEDDELIRRMRAGS